MTLSWEDIGYLTAFPCVMAGAQLLFKVTAGHARGQHLATALPIYLRQPSFYAALVAYGGATLLWLWLLGRYSLALAYPFTAIAFLLIPLLESLFFGVRTSLLYWLGLALIVAGAVAVARAQAG
jgi:undecaprenyl phosphate-alpha-L-ara4N flippase subunit ArnE